MFIAALFTIAKLWKQLRCQQPMNGKENMIYMYIYIYVYMYYSSIKNEIMSFAGKWMELEIIMFTMISQAQKAK
jgi:hypothetical protein